MAVTVSQITVEGAVKRIWKSSQESLVGLYVFVWMSQVIQRDLCHKNTAFTEIGHDAAKTKRFVNRIRGILQMVLENNVDERLVIVSRIHASGDLAEYRTPFRLTRKHIMNCTGNSEAGNGALHRIGMWAGALDLAL